jgi:hypothetical protein
MEEIKKEAPSVFIRIVAIINCGIFVAGFAILSYINSLKFLDYGLNSDLSVSARFVVSWVFAISFALSFLTGRKYNKLGLTLLISSFIMMLLELIFTGLGSSGL